MKRLFIILMVVGFMGSWQISQAAVLNQNKGSAKLEQKARTHKKRQQPHKKQKTQDQDSQKKTEETANTDSQKK